MSYIKHQLKNSLLLVGLFLVLLTLILSLTACSMNTSSNQNDVLNENDSNVHETVKIVYVEWASEEASSHVVKAIIEERLGYNTDLLPVSMISMWESVAAGDQDAMVAAWLPSLHKHYFQEHKNEIENLGPNLNGAITGLVVPDYVTIDSLEDLQENAHKFDEQIIGIDPEAGIMTKAAQILEEYNLDSFELITGSDATMTQTLENAIEEERWIVITGWNPHWKFAKWNLKYLEDPKNIFGDEENISTIVREGLQADMPDVYSFLDNFYWSASDMEQVMLWTKEENTTPEEAAHRWIEENKELVDTWIE